MASAAELVRRPDWPARLAAFLAARHARAFEWGPNDCASFAIAWVAELTGETVFEVTWSDARGAAEAIAAEGSMREAWTRTLGAPCQNWREARRGDVGLTDIDGRLCGVVCAGATWCGPGVDRLHHLPLERVQVFWKVG